MSALSPERLAEIRGALGAPNIELRGDPYEAILRTAGMADDLLAEVDRLREGIRALADEFDDPPGDLWYGPEYYSGLAGAANAARALLDPTEGGTDE